MNMKRIYGMVTLALFMLSALVLADWTTALAATDECQAVTKNNPGFGLIYESLIDAKGSAEVILTNLDKSGVEEFIGFHFGVVTHATQFQKTLFRTRETPVRVLPSDKQKIEVLLSSTKPEEWRRAIQCYRGTWDCMEDKGNKTKLRAALQDLIGTATGVVDSDSASCLLTGKLKAARSSENPAVTNRNSETLQERPAGASPSADGGASDPAR
jgi:hypothetical protein